MALTTSKPSDERDGDLVGVERGVADRAGEAVGRSQVERVDGLERLGAAELRGRGPAAGVDGHDVHTLPVVADRTPDT